MSTNYYFYINIDNETISNSLELNEYLLSQIYPALHIGKRSAGWLPLFEKTDFYSSVKELEEFYERNKDYLVIEDDYGWDMSFQELKEELIDWDGGPAAKGNPKDHMYMMDVYMDSEGYEFSKGGFS